MPVKLSDGGPTASPCGGLGKENVASCAPVMKGSLAKMFQEGANLIGLKKSENLFEQLESRNLTTDEQKIIQERVELQRRMLAAYEKQEKTRKVDDIRSVHSQLSEEEANKALEMCGNREEEAVASLAEPDFLCRVLAACKGPVLSAAPAQRKPRTSKPRKPMAGNSGDQVFVGNFRGKGYPGTAPKHAPVRASSHTTRREQDETPTPAPAANSASTAPEGQEGCDSLDAVDDSVDVGIYGDTEVFREVADGPQRYLLAKELSSGEVRPATTSEVEGLQTGQQTAAIMGKHALQTPPSVTSNKPKKHSVEVSEDTVKGAVRILMRQSKDKAIKFLQTMPPLVAERALAVIEEKDSKKAEVLASAFYGTAGSLAPIEEGAEEAEHDKQPAKGVKEALQKGSAPGRSTRKGRDAGMGKAEPDPSCAIEAVRSRTKKQIRPSRAAKSKALHSLASLDWSADGAQEMVLDTIATVEPEAHDSPKGKATVLGESADGSQGEGDGLTKAGELGSSFAEDSAPTNKDGEPVTSQAAAEKSKKAKIRSTKQTAANAKTQQPTEVDGGDADKAMAASPAEAHTQGDSKEPISAKSKAAISARGHPNRGRVRQKSHKSAELVEVGALRAERGWYNAGYIFPVGFRSKVNFRSSVELDQLCVHECSIVGKGGAFYPAPTFIVVAMDRPDEPLVAKSCTGCWTAVLKRINAEIEDRRGAGEDLPPPPKTAIAGPEYFGFNQAEIQDVIELLDPEHACIEYWQGKADREAHAAGLHVETSARLARPRPAAGAKKRRRRGRVDSSDEETQGSEDGDEDETAMMSNKWSAVSRHERYRKRCGGDGEAAYVDKDNPLPGLLDPITLEPVASPAISPWGHVMGMATWKAVLSESGQCPFTKNSLALWQCKLLTKRNLLNYKGKIVADEEVLKKFGLQ